MATNVSISPLQKEKDTFQDILPVVVNSAVASDKFRQVPDVANWVKKVSLYCEHSVIEDSMLLELPCFEYLPRIRMGTNV